MFNMNFGLAENHLRASALPHAVLRPGALLDGGRGTEKDIEFGFGTSSAFPLRLSTSMTCNIDRAR